MGCALESLIPFAASYEIIRQKKKEFNAHRTDFRHAV
jgi:hypothetical protein